MLEELYNKQVAFFKSYKTFEYEYRLDSLIKLRNKIIELEDEIATSLYDDLGKSKEESYLCEIGVVLSEITHAIKNLKKWMKYKKVKVGLNNFPSKGYRVFNPLGNVLIISPWNYPFNLCICPLIGAISAGNTVIIKPSEISFNTSRVVKKILSSVFSEEYVAVIEGDKNITCNLLNLKFDMIFFTGGTTVGKIVMESAAKNLSRVVLELGGKSPTIVTKSADLRLTAKRIIFGKLINAGQTCVAPDYILVDKAVKDDLVNHLIREINVQYPNSLNNNSYSQIINQRHFDRIINLLDKEKIVFGGNTKGLKIEPTIMDGVTFTDRVMKEEIFGPIIPIISYEDYNKCIDLINSLPHPLACYLFSRNKQEIEVFKRYAIFGGGCINDTIMHIVSFNLPFGGIGDSGIGEYHGKKSFEIFSHEKSILYKSSKIDIPLRYSPYTEKKTRIIKKILR